jgi:hypothetical protein
MKIFISYAREDGREMALRLHHDLRNIGYDTWLDLSEIEAGASWSLDIEKAIESSDLALALLSTGSYVSQICRAEQLRALRKGKRVIPLLIQPDAEPPLHLEHLNFIDFSDNARYDEMFRDLLSDITSSQAFRLAERIQESARRSPLHKLAQHKVTRPYAADEKRDARAFRRYIADLREETWLGARYWWPYFLFYYADIQEVASTLKGGALLSYSLRQGRRKVKREKWDNTVRLQFRPRTPELFQSEGFRPVERQRSGLYCPIPVYLLFDMEAVVCLPDSRFSDGDVTEMNKTFKASSAFRDMPFDLIYHDSWMLSEEKEEVMRYRRAQVIVSDKLGLESLQYVWCRSQAEYETLHTLLPDEVWRKWRDKITVRTDYALFNRKWAYVDQAVLERGQARFRFNRCEYASDCGPFTARAEIESLDGKKHEWQQENFGTNTDLTLDLSDLNSPYDYSVRLYLDDDLAYAGRYSADNAPF